MATIIDSLIVRFGLDSRGFDDGNRRVNNNLNNTRRNVNETDKSLKALTTTAAKFLAVIGGATTIKAFIESTVESSAAIYRLSQNLNVAVETLSAWGNAATLAGGTAEGLQGTMSMLSKAQTELQLTGQSGLIPYFSALNVAFSEIDGKARPVNDLLLDLADRFEGMERSKANNIGLMMGIDQGTLNAMFEGRKSLELLIKRQNEFNVVTKRQGEESVRLQRSFRETKLELSAFGRELLSQATPALEKLFSVLTDTGRWMIDNKEVVGDFLKIMGVGLSVIVAAAIPINAAALAITGLGSALALAWQDYKVWERGGQTALPWEKWVPTIKVAIDWIKQLGSVLETQFYRTIAFVDLVRNGVTGNWDGVKFAWSEFLNGGKQSASNSTGAGQTLIPSANNKNLPRGIRNNNPGNLNYAGQAGASKEGGAGGRFAVFGNMQQGVAALVKQLGLYMKRGKNTIRKILETYAPSSENDTSSYINTVAKSLGVNPDQPLNPNDENQIVGLVRAITRHENGGNYVNDADIRGGFNLAKGGGNRSSSNQTTIGEIKVYTQATDAKTIAADIGSAMDDYLFVSQATAGAF
jgi:hypothetical protein